MKKLLLTVNVITYNHRLWIKECLDSILEQETDFDFIVRIFDDCSTDGTLGICEQYVKKHPEKVFLYPSEKNLGSKYNPLRSYRGIATPYYLYIEGDDYRINKKGFQKQVDILENHPECSFCAAKTINFEKNEFVNSHPNLPEGVYDKKFVLDNPGLYKHANLGTRIVRTECIDIVENYEEYYLWDISQYYELFENGSMYFIHDEYMVYRMTGSGVATEKNGLDISVYMAMRGSIYIKYRKSYYLNMLYVVFMELNAAIVKECIKNTNINTNDIRVNKIYKVLKNIRRKILYMILPGFVPVFMHSIRDYLRVLRNRKYR